MRKETRYDVRMLDITYDPELDAAHINLGSGKVADREEVTPNLVLDYDREGRVVGIEVLGASKILAPSAWQHARRPGESRPGLSLPPLDPRERARLIAEAQEASRRLRDDPADQALLDEIIDMQAENAAALEP
jgi:uncharacterized protein YuzE